MATTVTIVRANNKAALPDGTALDLDTHYPITGGGSYEVWRDEAGDLMASRYDRAGGELYWLPLDKDGTYNLHPTFGQRVLSDQEVFIEEACEVIRHHLKSCGYDPETLDLSLATSDGPIEVTYGGGDGSYRTLRTDGEIHQRSVETGGVRRRRDRAFGDFYDDDFVEWTARITGGRYVIVNHRLHRAGLVSMDVHLRSHCTLADLKVALQDDRQ